MTHAQSIGATIKAQRTAQGLTQAQLGARLDCHASLVGKLETGQRLTHRMCAKAAAALGFTWSTLIAKAEELMRQ